MLLEMMLALAVAGILFGASYILYENIPFRNDLDDAAFVSQSLLRKAELYSMAVMHDDSWGVRFEPDRAILFKGTSYDNRDESYDEVVQVFAEPSGVEEYFFEKVSGRPESSGETTYSGTLGESKTVSVNAYGRISID
jgi:hypothetical protein